jgi:hypothetical protein
VEDIEQGVVIDGGSGIHLVKISDASSPVPRGPGVLTDDSLSGIAAGTFYFRGDFGDGIAITLGTADGIF